MRRYVKENYDYAGKNGEAVAKNTQSVDVRGYGIKLAGSHYEKIYDCGKPNPKDIGAPFGGSQM